MLERNVFPKKYKQNKIYKIPYGKKENIVRKKEDIIISLRKKENICWILLKFLGFVDGLLGAEEVLRGRR
jgi:hypothetical protein